MLRVLLRVWVDPVSAVFHHRAVVWVSRVTSCFRCFFSIFNNKPHPPTLTFNLIVYSRHPSIQTPPCSPPFEDKIARWWCLDGSRQVQRPAPTIPRRSLGDRGNAQGGEGVKKGC